MDKTVLSAQDLLQDSFQLGIEILESGFEPTLLIDKSQELARPTAGGGRGSARALPLTRCVYSA